MNLLKRVKNFSFKTNTVQSPVQIDFSLIRDQHKDLYSKIEEAYNDDGLGVIVVNNIPGFSQKREALLPLAQKIANLSIEERREMEAPQFHYSTGWSHGKEKFEGKPDLLKGSYYANPCFESWENP